MTEHRVVDPLEAGLAFILREGEADYPLHFILLHGKGGDERVMWALEPVLPEAAPVATLRGAFTQETGGYQWSAQDHSVWAVADDFSAAARRVMETLGLLYREYAFDPERIALMGFSQGGALSFTLAKELNPKPSALVVLAGFLPQEFEGGLQGLPVFWGHGLRDEHVPIARARADVRRLEELGAQVQYCEADVGHKLGVECTRGLEAWLDNLTTV